MSKHLSPAALRSLFETTVAAMLATSGLAFGCGGGLAEDSTTDRATDAGAREDTSSADAGVVPTLTASECGMPAPMFDAKACGEGGARMADEFCGAATRQVPCDLDAGTADTGACQTTQLADELCSTLCWHPEERCNFDGGPRCKSASHIGCYLQNRGGGRTLECQDQCPGGRRLGGYGGEPSFARNPLGRFFARLAQLETVSIVAFGVLARELLHHDAPKELVGRAISARRDEVRHARVTWRLAQRFGARPTRLERARRMAPRSLLEMAKENAREGCVRETYGAIVTAHQARAATDGEIAGAMESITRDESVHAAFAWDLHRFFDARLGAEERAEVAATLRDAFTELRSEVSGAERTDDDAKAGLPARAVALRAIDQLEQALAA